MNLKYNAKTDTITNDDDYFFWLGQISNFICSHASNEMASKSIRYLFLANNKTDYFIINNIKLKINLLTNRLLSDSKAENFNRILSETLEYNASQTDAIRNNSNHFLIGFHSECLF